MIHHRTSGDRLHSSTVETLEIASGDAHAHWYRIPGPRDEGPLRWIVSTPWTREICNRPELLGWEYTNHLRQGMAAALAAAPFAESLRTIDQRRLCVLNVLRGGLNFGLRDALHDAFGANRHPSVFMSSQRYHDGVDWRIREDSYRKLAVPDGAVLFLGDVVATGVTAAHGFDVLYEHLVASGTSLHSIVFFTIGGAQVERVVRSFAARCRREFADFVEAHVVFVEGRFAVVEPASDLPLALPGTDLVRTAALLAPDLEATHPEIPEACLERCAIYDAGARAFDVAEYLDDVVGYWAGLGYLADDGLRLDRLADLRWPSSVQGPDHPHQEIRRRWRAALLADGDDEGALRRLCARRTDALRTMEESR
jgi:uracil phosphoribosyltransferase